MTMALSHVSTSNLQRLREGLQCDRIRTPITEAALTSFGIREQQVAMVGTLGGHSLMACLAILDTVLAERVALRRPPPELVWTGPETDRATARDTAVVLRELFEGARERVVLAGFCFTNAEKLLAPLHEGMVRRGVRTHFFVQVDQPRRVPGDAYGQEQMGQFIQDSWPFGRPFPELYCDRRTLVPGPPFCILHSKCVAVDGRRAFVTSANFTTSGQEYNLETGVLLEDPAFAAQLERQWMQLATSRHMVKWGFAQARVVSTSCLKIRNPGPQRRSAFDTYREVDGHTQYPAPAQHKSTNRAGSRPHQSPLG